MNAREMQMVFDVAIQQIDPDYEIAKKPDSYTIFKYINQAQLKVVTTRYTGNNPRGESYEESQKRIDDLRELTIEVLIPTVVGGSLKRNSFTASIPTDYMYKVGEEVDLDISGNVIRTGITETTADRFVRDVSNPYSEHLLHYNLAKPLRIFREDLVELITDGNYTVTDYLLRYIKLPNEIQLDGSDCELPEHIHQEIVNTAVALFLNDNTSPEAAEQELNKQE